MVRAHLGPLNNQPLTIHFVGDFFFVASLLPGFNRELVTAPFSIWQGPLILPLYF